MNEKNIKFAERFLFLALIIAAAVPLVVVKGIGHPFLTPKELLFRLALAAALPALAYVISVRGLRQPDFLGWTVLALLAILTLSTIFSVDPAISFWGYAERLTGLITVFLVALFGLGLFVLFRAPGRARIFLIFWGALWGIILTLSYYERLFTGPWAQFHSEFGRVISTIGNPIFFAAAVMAAVPPLAVAALGFRGRVKRYLIAALILGAGILTIVFTETRGAYLGVLAGAAVAAMALCFWSPNRKVKALTFALPILALATLGGLYFVRDSTFAHSNRITSRIVSIFNTADPSQIQRFQLWRLGLRAIGERPILGWGLENFDIALDRLYDPGFTRYGVANSNSDRVHNSYLDFGVAGGIPALLAFVAFFAALASKSLKLRRQGALSNAQAALALAAVAAYAVQSLTGFETLVSLVGLAVGAALLASLASNNIETKKIQVPAGLATVVAGAFSLALIFTGVIPLFRGSLAVHRSTVAVSGVDLNAAADMIGGFWNPYRASEEHRIANDIFKATGNSPQWSDGLTALIKKAEALETDAVSRKPDYFSFRFTLGNIQLVEALNGLRPYDDAIKAFELARPLAPKRQIVDFQLGNVYLAEKKPLLAVASFRAALAFAPEVPEAHWHLGRGLAEAGDAAAAAAEFETSIKGGFFEDRPAFEYSAAIKAFVAMNNLEETRRIYRAWLRTEPANAGLYANLAAVDAALGRKDEVLLAVKRAIELDGTIAAEIPDFFKKYGLAADALDGLPRTATINLASNYD